MPAPRRPRCGEPLPTGDYGPANCRQCAQTEAKRLGDLLTAERRRS
jgi:hypothetical protein